MAADFFLQIFTASSSPFCLYFDNQETVFLLSDLRHFVLSKLPHSCKLSFYQYTPAETQNFYSTTGKNLQTLQSMKMF